MTMKEAAVCSTSYLITSIQRSREEQLYNNMGYSVRKPSTDNFRLCPCLPCYSRNT